MKTGYYLETSQGVITHKLVGISSDNKVIIEDVETLQFSKMTIDQFCGGVVIGDFFLIFYGDGYKSNQDKNSIAFVLEAIGY